jgi:hypothetical protein
MAMHEFSPPRWLRGGHRMTLYSWARRRAFPGLPPPVPRYFDVEPGTQVLADCHWQANPPAHPSIVVLHGLEGSSQSHYVRGVADKAFSRGFNVVRLNQRNCGGTEHLSEGLYHSGLTSDVKAVLEELATADRLERLAVCGYSLGGNLALKLAGDFGDRPPAWLRAVCAVSPTLELGACMDLMERLENRLYEWNFMYGLRGRIRRKARLFPDRYDVSRLWRVRTIRAFDDRFTAPHNGYANADDYYYRAASMRVVDRIRLPTLIISAEDDPFIPVAPLRDPRVAGNPCITVVITPHGGHCGFLGRARDGYDGYWAEEAVIEFAAARAGAALPAPGTGARVDA